MSAHSFPPSIRRWLRFNLVGAIGIVVQLLLLGLLTSGFQLNYMLATSLAVEATVLHNFIWHERYTWADGERDWRAVSARLLRFNVTTGAVSIGGNLLLMRLLVGELHLRPFVANLASITVCSLLNFAASDRWVFRPKPLLGPKAKTRDIGLSHGPR